MLRRLLRDFPGDGSSADIVILSALTDRSSRSRREMADRIRTGLLEGGGCEESAPGRYSMASLHLEQGFCDEALEELGALVGECPGHPLAPFALLDSAACRLKRGEQLPAGEAYRAVAEKYPESPLMPGVLYLQGVLALELGEYEQASVLLGRIPPGTGTALEGAAAFQQGKAFHGMGRAREAYDEYRRSRRLSPQGMFSQRAAFRAAEIARTAGWKAEAAELYRIVVSGREGELTELGREGLREVERGSGEDR